MTESAGTKRTWKSRRVIIPAVAALAVIGIGGGLLAAGVADDDLRGDTRDRAGEVAIQEAGGGRVTDAEEDDGFYEVEVTREDGTEVDVRLDKDYAVVGTETDGPDDERDDRYDDDRYDDRDDDLDQSDRDADDQPLTAAETKAAEKAALDQIGGGRVTDVDREGMGRDLGFEVEVTAPNGAEWNVLLDGDFQVLSAHRD